METKLCICLWLDFILSFINLINMHVYLKENIKEIIQETIKIIASIIGK